MGKTKYSRRTWRKSTLSATMSTRRLEYKGCPLCSDRSIPENLNVHVNDDQTCADVHLQLTMLRYDSAMCAVGQEKYEELCCTAKSSSGFKSSLGLMIGVVVAGFFLKRVFSHRRRRIRQEKEIYDDEELPGTVSFSSRGSRNSSRSGTTDLEMPSSSYVNMDESNPKSNAKMPKTNGGKKGRHPSRSRDRSHGELDNKNGRNVSRLRDGSRSCNQRREIPETNRSSRNRPTSRRHERSHSRPRDMQDMPETKRSNRERPVSRSRAQSRSRARDMSQQAHSSRDRSISRSRARSRSRPREMVENHSINRSRTGRPRSRSRSRSRARGKPETQEVDIYHSDGYNGSRLPTQVL